MAKYFNAGIPEYWIIDARRDQLTFRVLARGESAYVDVPADAEGFAHSSVLSARVRLVRDRNRIGRWRYRLETVE